jgi:hypothetical protein
MKNIARGLALLLIQFLFINSVSSAPACKGPNKNDPGCAVAEAAPAAIAINSATVDWLNEKIIVRGENFSGSTTITIAGLAATIGTQTADQIEIPFDAAIGGIPKGNHNLVAEDGPSASSSSISLFIKAGIIDQSLINCPCESEWITALGSLWNPGEKATECFEIAGGAGEPVDIAGTVLTDATDPDIYPHYPIGAAFTAEPEESVCRLTQVSTPLDATAVTDLVKIRINRAQQGSCHDILVANICSTVTPVP